MAADWIPCGNGFIEADVIRWVEAIWAKPGRGRAQPVGERAVTAEVIRDADGWLDLLIRNCQPAGAEQLPDIGRLPANRTVRRRRSTVEKGRPARLPWSDETARAALIARRPGQR